jgi:hypothetical protein
MLTKKKNPFIWGPWGYSSLKDKNKQFLTLEGCSAFLQGKLFCVDRMKLFVYSLLVDYLLCCFLFRESTFDDQLAVHVDANNIVHLHNSGVRVILYL